jgi:hypothetical protein
MSINSVHPSRFSPPFCPRPTCVAHRARGKGFNHNGWYRKPSSREKIPRCTCLDCGKSCSRSTFSPTYYLKKPALLTAVASGLVACSAHRQIARSNHCAKTTVTRMAERISRHAILFHQRCLAHLPPLDEVVVHDHFEAFIGRQDRALGIGTAVGFRSWFIYDIDPAPHRGSGRRPDRKPDQANVPSAAYIRSIKRTFQALIPHVSEGAQLVCHVDGRKDYLVAAGTPEFESRVALRIYPNPKRGPKGSPRSREALERDRAMFPIDQLHQFLRHTYSEHKRETISFGRRLESIVGRAFLIAVWKNFIKGRSERKPDRTTPAMKLGLTDERWSWARLFTRRLFLEREPVSEIGRVLYRKSWTKGLPKLALKHAG